MIGPRATALPVCVVAGVGPGMGRAVAQRFAREGFAVALLARRADALQGYVRAIEKAGGIAVGYQVDLADSAATRAVMERVAAEMGPAQVLVYNAGVWREAVPMTLAPAEFTRDLELCATGALACAQAVYGAMKQAGSGSMLFTGGGLALRPEFGGSVLSLTAGKSALRGLALALAPRLVPEGIHVAMVTIAGTVARGTAFDPELIAETYWMLHNQPPAEWQAEIVIDGQATTAA